MGKTSFGKDRSKFGFLVFSHARVQAALIPRADPVRALRLVLSSLLSCGDFSYQDRPPKPLARIRIASIVQEHLDLLQ
jgi:hypothetical protein